jgi:hypothetical protein
LELSLDSSIDTSRQLVARRVSPAAWQYYFVM